ncbi:hypothetical protein N2152v2_008644 [Parachlorella kessleri]
MRRAERAFGPVQEPPPPENLCPARPTAPLLPLPRAISSHQPSSHSQGELSARGSYQTDDDGSCPSTAEEEEEDWLLEGSLFTMYLADDHHLVACDELGNEVFTFEVASETAACDADFQRQARHIVASMLQRRRLDELAQQAQQLSRQGAVPSNNNSSSRRRSGQQLQQAQQLPDREGPMALAINLCSRDISGTASEDTPPEGVCWEDEQEEQQLTYDRWYAARLQADEDASAAAAGLAGTASPAQRPTNSKPRQAWLQAASGSMAGSKQPDFPSLPPPSEPPPRSAQISRHRPRAGGRPGSSLQWQHKGQQQGKGHVRVLNKGCKLPPEGPPGIDADVAAGTAEWDSLAAHVMLESTGLRVHQDDIDLTLLLYGDDKVREAALVSAAQQAERDSAGAVGGPTTNDMRHMMGRVAAAAAGGAGSSSGSTDRCTTTAPYATALPALGTLAPATPVPRSAYVAAEGHTGANAELDGSDSAAEEHRYGKKSLRKIGSGGGHQRFERVFPELGGWKQVYFMSCTPSDVRYIWAVRAGLARMDRLAAHKRAEFLAGQ